MPVAATCLALSPWAAADHMSDLLALSARIIDSGTLDGPPVRITQELSELGDGIAVVESFSNSVAVRTGDGLVVFDASGWNTGPQVVDALQAWTGDPVDTVVYTHGHLDHVGGSPAFVRRAAAEGHRRPRFVGHEAILRRFARYRRTDAWNRIINARQFGIVKDRALGIGAGHASDGRGEQLFLPASVAEPDVTYRDTHPLEVGGTAIHLHHARGETDDHTWAWIPSLKVICAGDFFIWHFPNAGNPQKVQRYPDEWAQALRAMAELEPELFIPAHGLPIGGARRIRSVLLDVAGVLEDLVASVVSSMNAGATLDEVVRAVRVPDEVLERPYLRPFYDEPDFVVRNVWRLYGGWWDGNAARLKPAPDSAVASEVARLAGGAGNLSARATELAEEGRVDLACQLAEWAVQASPNDDDSHRVRARVYRLAEQRASSLMAKGIYAGAAGESERSAEMP